MKNLTINNLLAFCAVALLFGSMGPWITFLGAINGGPANFLEVGLVVFGGIGLVVLSALTGKAMRSVSIFVGALILAEVVYVWFVLSEADTNELVSPGWGLFVSGVTAVLLIASTWVTKKRV